LGDCRDVLFDPRNDSLGEVIELVTWNGSPLRQAGGVNVSISISSSESKTLETSDTARGEMFSREAPKAVASYAAAQAQALTRQLREEADPIKQEALQGELNKWKEGGL